MVVAGLELAFEEGVNLLSGGVVEGDVDVFLIRQGEFHLRIYLQGIGEDRQFGSCGAIRRGNLNGGWSGDGGGPDAVEDAAELRLPGRHVVRLEARPPNADGVGGVRVRDLLRNALRMRPDRIVVGEVRGAEAFDMVQALSTGHDGSLSTCHANGPLDAIRRLEALAAMAGVGLPAESLRGQLAAAIDLVVHVSRRPDGRRVVASVHEVEVRAADGDPLSTRCLADEHGIVAGPLRAARAHGAAPYVAPRPGDGVPEPGEAVA